MFFGAGIGKLSHSMKSLQQAWDSTEDGWRDKVRADLAKGHIDPTLASAAKALRAMDDLADMFSKIYRDLS